MGNKGGGAPSQPTPPQVTYPNPSQALSSGQQQVNNNMGAYINSLLASREGFYGKTPMDLYPLHYQNAQFPTFNPTSYYNQLYANNPQHGGVGSLQGAFGYKPGPGANNPYQWGGSANTAAQQPNQNLASGNASPPGKLGA